MSETLIELKQDADKLRSKIGHNEIRLVFDLAQLVERLICYLHERELAQQEID